MRDALGEFQPENVGGSKHNGNLRAISLLAFSRCCGHGCDMSPGRAAPRYSVDS